MLRRLGLLRQHVRPKELQQSVELFQVVLPRASGALFRTRTLNPAKPWKKQGLQVKREAYRRG